MDNALADHLSCWSPQGQRGPVRSTPYDLLSHPYDLLSHVLLSSEPRISMIIDARLESAEDGCGWTVQLISGIKKTETPAPLAVFLRFLRGSAAGASGFLSPKLPKMG